MKCILCKNDSIELFIVVDNKTYWKCNNCFVKFLDKKHYLNSKSERKHYLKHENYFEHKGYQKFLSKLYLPLKQKLSKNDVGLDYGCGHGPVLAQMLKLDGLKVDLYDPFFYPNKEIFNKKYNFITCTEVVEHFFDPYKQFNNLDKLLKKNAWLAIMTTFYQQNIAFKNLTPAKPQ